MQELKNKISDLLILIKKMMDKVSLLLVIHFICLFLILISTSWMLFHDLNDSKFDRIKTETRIDSLQMEAINICPFVECDSLNFILKNNKKEVKDENI